MLTALDTWTDAVRAAFAGYSEPLLRVVAATLLKPRNPLPLDELPDRLLGTLANPPVVDRRIQSLPPSARKLLAVIGLTRQPKWKVGHLLTISASLGHVEGFAPLRALLDLGFLYYDRPPDAPPLETFDPPLADDGTVNAVVFAHPMVSERAKGEPFGLPDLSAADGPKATEVPRLADGLEWPLRLAAVWQLAAETPFRRTQTSALFKRDAQRLQSSDLLSSPPSDHVTAVAEAGGLAFAWSAAAGLLLQRDDELHSGPDPLPPAPLFEVLADLTAGLFGIEAWDPLLGSAGTPVLLPPFPSAVALTLLLLARAGGWVEPHAIATWLWEHHPSWQGVLTKDAQKEAGRPWAEAFLLGVAYPLRLVEVLDRGGWFVRLSDLGRWLFAGGPKPAEPPAFPQGLLVQPNAEVLAFRQGLTPALISKLTRFARWKALGAACTLELTPEQTYRALEAGQTLAAILQTLNQHATRPVPPAVADLLQRWANKRDRITVYAAATLVEFQTAAELDAAVARGIVAVKVSERIGVCADGGDPDYKHLRLTGNRDYDAKPGRCVAVAEDGVTLAVDAGLADLLLDAEIGRVADPLPDEPTGPRRFRLTPESVRRAMGGLSLEDLDAWFITRTGERMPAAGRLFALAAAMPASHVAKLTVLRLPNPDAVDGLFQWPTTRPLVADRLGPKAVAVEEDRLPTLLEVLRQLGVKVDIG